MTRRELLASSSATLLRGADEKVSWMAIRGGSLVGGGAWPDAGKALHMGSLLKPFLAVAWLRSGKKSVIVDCRGPGCWKAGGHGQQTLVQAIANSCNVYFLRLAAVLDRASLDMVCLSYGLELPLREWNASRLLGLGAGWPQRPAALTQAFASLSEERVQASVQPVLAGMALCAASGTAKAASLKCYAKTGTAPCVHVPRGSGDGFAVGLYPLEQPRCVLLVRQHNTPGAKAAGLLRPLLIRLA